MEPGWYVNVFITDTGEEIRLQDTTTGEVLILPRYGVWMDGEVVKVSDSLDALQEEFGPGLSVQPIGRAKSDSLSGH